MPVMLRITLLALALCSGSALAGSTSLRGAVAEAQQQQQEDKSQTKEGTAANPCDVASPVDSSHGSEGEQGEARRNTTAHEAAASGSAVRSNATQQQQQHHHQQRAPRGEVLTLYHQTSAEIAALIFEGGFKPGTRGWCGGGIYFAMKPWQTYHKAIGPNSHLGSILEVEVDLGRVRHMSPTCDRSMTAEKMFADGYDSIRFNPGDGDEIVVYSPASILSVKHFAWS